MRHIILTVIRFYQHWISPLLGPRCRFNPSCSQYCFEAVQSYGMLRGLMMTVVRLLKCHPLHPGGIDPVPKGKRSA